MQYVVKTVTNSDSNLIYFNYGISKKKKYNDTCTSFTDQEFICITVYKISEFNEYCEHVKSLLDENILGLNVTL